MATGGDKLQIMGEGEPPVVVNQPGNFYQDPPSYPQPYGGGVPMGSMPSSHSHHTTTVVVNQPAPTTMGPRMWSSNICDCCNDMGSCLLGWFCPCVLASNVAQDMGESCCVPCCVPGWLIVLRAKLRAENNIQGSVMDDCCVVCCCGHCVLCQMAREVKYVKMMNAQQPRV